MEEPLGHEDEKIARLRRAMYSRALAGKLKEPPRHQLTEEGEPVGEDWQRRDASASLPRAEVAPRALLVTRVLLRWVATLSVVFFIGAVGFFLYYFLAGAGSSATSSANIDIAVSGPTRVSGGEVTQMQITVTNRNPVALDLVDLVITYPSGTRSPVDFSSDFTTQRISLGTIEPGGQRQGTVSAVFAGNTNNSVDVKIDLEYRLHGSSALFVAHSDYSTTLSSSPVSLSVNGKTEAISGQPLEFTVTVSSNTSQPVKDVLLSAHYPFGFSFSSANPTPKSSGVWELGDLSPGQQRTITIRGSLAGESGDERTFQFTTGTRATPQDTTISTPLSSNTFKTTISQPFLGLTLATNDSTDPIITLSPGTPVKVSLQWQNNLDTTITDAVLVARLSGVQIDGTQVHSTDGFFRSTDDTVLWDKTTTNGALATLAPGAHGTVSFTFVMPTSDQLQNIRNPSLAISVSAAGNRVSETGVPQSLQSTVSQKLALASDLQIATQGLYYANPFGVQGPMPPKAGTETDYAVVFTVTNTTNPITNGKLTIQLPPYVRWTGVYAPKSENISFNQQQSTLTWDMGTIDANTGLNGTAPRRAEVSIGFTPSTSQIGQEPSLAQNISFTGTDATTGSTISRAVPDVTTNIVGDPGFVSTSATVVR